MREGEDKDCDTLEDVEQETPNILPGVFNLQKGYNAFQGVPLYEGGQSSKDIFTFTFEKKKGTSGEKSFVVPDQMDVPPLNAQCHDSNRVTDFTYGNSSEFMTATSNTVSHEHVSTASAAFSQSLSSARKAS